MKKVSPLKDVDRMAAIERRLKRHKEDQLDIFGGRFLELHAIYWNATMKQKAKAFDVKELDRCLLKIESLDQSLGDLCKKAKFLAFPDCARFEKIRDDFRALAKTNERRRQRILNQRGNLNMSLRTFVKNLEAPPINLPLNSLIDEVGQAKAAETLIEQFFNPWFEKFLKKKCLDGKPFQKLKRQLVQLFKNTK